MLLLHHSHIHLKSQIHIIKVWVGDTCFVNDSKPFSFLPSSPQTHLFLSHEQMLEWSRAWCASSKPMCAIRRAYLVTISIWGFARSYQRQHKRILQKLGRPRVQRMTFHTFLHWKATKGLPQKQTTSYVSCVSLIIRTSRNPWYIDSWQPLRTMNIYTKRQQM